MKTLLWLDDVRNPHEGNWLHDFSPLKPPYGVFWVKSYKEFIDYIAANGLPDAICFDHDISKDEQEKLRSKGISKKKCRQLVKQSPHYKTGYDCAKWLVEYCLDRHLKIPDWSVQSSNPVGKDNINGATIYKVGQK